eukprot:TRINITY_DN29005_c0_g1_i1.p1 TRINITY_DN29005_c0_g1~~TRINITY_DN29005_c0_g1_i1.p1  ORF type:complete len:209 (+),score=51.80 TRINITY_DN29005_c0_g1_i1:94-627(+)
MVSDTAATVLNVAVAAAAGAAAGWALLAGCGGRGTAAGLRSVAALRLEVGADLRQGVIAAAQRSGMKAACVLTCVGSLRKAHIRLAGAGATGGSPEMHLDERLEIVSLVGTVSADGSCHLHICVADERGRAVGGHLMDGCEVNTTAEIVVADCDGFVFSREHDQRTGYRELTVRRSG